MPSCRSSSAGAGNRDVSGWLHLQFLLSSSRVEQRETPWTSLYSCHSCRADQSYLEYSRTPQLSDRSSSLGRSQTSRTSSSSSFVGCQRTQASCPSLAKGAIMLNHQLA